MIGIILVINTLFMRSFLFFIGFLLPSVLFAQADHDETFYRQALKKFDTVKSMAPDSIIIPRVKEMDNSPAANEYLHREMVAAFLYEGAHNRDAGDLKPWMEKSFGMPFDSIQDLGRQFGDDYLVWLYARHLLPSDIQERYLLCRLNWYAKEAWLAHARRFLSDMERYFPQSSHLNDARAAVQVLESKVAAQKDNKHIHFRPAVHSLAELLAPYKGKVVYLDIWGTWCVPCLHEMTYAPALKQKFDTAKVVFLYLDEDQDEDDVKWREYAQLYAVTGEHVRMNQQDIEGIWEALLHTHNVARRYPSYFIIGRDGQLVQPDAKRPSEGEALYNQLRAAIDAP